MSKVSHCKTCRTEILWAISPKGKSLPVDAMPCENGEYVISHTNPLGVRILAKFDECTFPENARVRRYTSHFKTCPYPSFQQRGWKMRTTQPVRLVGAP